MKDTSLVQSMISPYADSAVPFLRKLEMLRPKRPSIHLLLATNVSRTYDNRLVDLPKLYVDSNHDPA
jgi:hypothetical protein